MKFTRLFDTAVAAVSAAALMFAPAAAAAPSDPQHCTYPGDGNSVCESPGNAQIVATPPPMYYQSWGAYPFGPLFGLGGRHGYR